MRPFLAEPMRLVGSGACFSTPVIDDMLHLTFSAEVHRQWCHKRVEQPSWDYNAALNMHRMVSEVVINPNAKGFVVNHVVVHLVSRVSCISIGLRYVVRELGLVEISLTIISRPVHQIFQSMLNGKAVHGHVSSNNL